jgi:beta-lactamase superfamily II metal-dependent hydrolase
MMHLRVYDVEHGACAMFVGPTDALAVIDCGHNSSTGWRPGKFIAEKSGRKSIDYFLSTNVDQDHISDLDALTRAGISIRILYSNTGVSPPTLREIKKRCGPLTADAEAFLRMRETFGPPGSGSPFKEVMGGIELRSFGHSHPKFEDTNNLSQAYFIKYGGFQILFPGDLERNGWRAHLLDTAFVASLRETTILVASHHGRESGFCEEVLNS